MEIKGKIVIVGFGWVGQANALALTKMGYEVCYFDLGQPVIHYSEHIAEYSKIKRLENVLELDSENTTYIVCVGDRVADDGTQDISFIKSALNSLKDGKGIVVLRSTVIPDLLATLDFHFYVPEFLHEKTAIEECLNPHFFVVGTKDPLKKEPEFFDTWRKRTPLLFNGTPRDVAMVKYLSNLWNSTRIAFANEFGDIIGDPNSKESVDKINRILDVVLGNENYVHYGRAFGGHCLPKDTRAFVHWYESKGKNTNLLEGVSKSNDAHEKVQEKYVDIPEIFSAWESPHLSGFVAGREFAYSVKKNILDPREFIARYRTKVLWTALVVLAIILALSVLTH